MIYQRGKGQHKRIRIHIRHFTPALTEAICDNDEVQMTMLDNGYMHNNALA